MRQKGLGYWVEFPSGRKGEEKATPHLGKERRMRRAHSVGQALGGFQRQEGRGGDLAAAVCKCSEPPGFC